MTNHAQKSHANFKFTFEWLEQYVRLETNGVVVWQPRGDWTFSNKPVRGIRDADNKITHYTIAGIVFPRALVETTLQQKQAPALEAMRDFEIHHWVITLKTRGGKIETKIADSKDELKAFLIEISDNPINDLTVKEVHRFEYNHKSKIRDNGFSNANSFEQPASIKTRKIEGFE